MGDSGTTSGSFCVLHKSDRSILFQALIEEAQVKLGKLSHVHVIDPFMAPNLLNLEQQLRKLMGKVSGHKNLEKYLTVVDPNSILNEEDTMEMDCWVTSIGGELNLNGVPMGWINYSTLSKPALTLAEFTTALRTAECVFHQFLEEEGNKDEFEIESKYLNRLSKVSHMAMTLQDFLDKDLF